MIDLFKDITKDFRVLLTAIVLLGLKVADDVIVKTTGLTPVEIDKVEMLLILSGITYKGDAVGFYQALYRVYGEQFVGQRETGEQMRQLTNEAFDKWEAVCDCDHCKQKRAQGSDGKVTPIRGTGTFH